jgi:tripartite ATP-independent transporter DctM subunit
MIVYALVAQNVSIGALFAAGIVPGILMGIGMMVIVHVIARRRRYPAEPGRVGSAEALAIVGRFLIAALLPVILVGGIVGGVFTPVESGAVAALYAIVTGFLVTRTLTIKALYAALRKTGIISSVVFLMMGVANVASWILTTQQVPQAAARAITALTSDPLVFLLLVNLLLLLVGCVLDTVAAMVMFGPLLIPMAAAFGIDPLHFGMVVVLNLVIGLVTPPVGICLFIASGLGKVPIEPVFKESLPFLAWLLVVLMAVTYFPGTFLWVPRALGFS